MTESGSKNFMNKRFPTDDFHQPPISLFHILTAAHCFSFGGHFYSANKVAQLRYVVGGLSSLSEERKRRTGYVHIHP
jgi:hypothetical protein